jgi:hypothetical protein
MKRDFNPLCITYSQMNLIFNLRIAWRRLTSWIRAYIISRYVGIGTEEELFSSLYLEALNFSVMLQVIFGREISRENTSYLYQYTILLRELISAQLSGDMEAVQQTIDRLYQNANENAAFLASINPYWNEAEWQEMLGTYLQYTLEEANSFTSGDYKKDIETFDRITALTNRMGDVFAQGLYNYLTSGQQSTATPPPLIEGMTCLTEEQMNGIYNIRMFWFELVTWVRNYMLSRYYNIGDVDEVKARLQQVPLDYVNALKQFFGENPAEGELQSELNTFIDLLDDMITAQMEGNIDEINRITQLFYQNADARAASVSKLNPYWNENEWRARIYNNVRSTLDESTTFLTGDFARNLDIFTTLLDQAESTSGYFAQGLINYLHPNESSI